MAPNHDTYFLVRGAKTGDMRLHDQYFEVASSKLAIGTLKKERFCVNHEERQRLKYWLSLGTNLLPRATAEAVLKGAPDGTFIFRRGSKLGSYAVSVIVAGAVKNFQILRDDDGQLACVDSHMTGGKKVFKSIANLLMDAQVRAVWNLRYWCMALDKVGMNLHALCRQGEYIPGHARFHVPDGLVSWETPFPGYRPVSLTTLDVLQASPQIADPPTFTAGNMAQWNALDNHVDRRIYDGTYDVIDDILPLNPMGRTGVVGRGALLRWGPNHVAQPLITRLRREASGKNVLEFVGVLDSETKMWTLPMGPHEPNDFRCNVIKSEFGPQGVAQLNLDVGRQSALLDALSTLFDPHRAKVIYQGYLDHPLNTDNAWIETSCVHYHDDAGILDPFPLYPQYRGVGKITWVVLDEHTPMSGVVAEWQSHLLASADAAALYQ